MEYPLPVQKFSRQWRMIVEGTLSFTPLIPRGVVAGSCDWAPGQGSRVSAPVSFTPSPRATFNPPPPTHKAACLYTFSQELSEPPSGQWLIMESRGPMATSRRLLLLLLLLLHHTHQGWALRPVLPTQRAQDPPAVHLSNGPGLEPAAVMTFDLTKITKYGVDLALDPVPWLCPVSISCSLFPVFLSLSVNTMSPKPTLALKGHMTYTIFSF